MQSSVLACVIFALPFIWAAPLEPLPSFHAHETSLIDGKRSIVDLLDNVIGNILPPTPIDSESLLNSTIQSIRTDLTNTDEVVTAFAGLFQAILNTAPPDSLSDALEQIGSLLSYTTDGSSITLQNVAQALLNGLSVTDLTQNVLAGYLSNINSFTNYNNPPPLSDIYPKSASDAPYGIPEAQLRAAIYIPPAFTFGTKRPILFVPGTGTFGGVTYISNLGKLLAQDYDPVYLNVPGAMWNDTQINAEYIAYAMNYVSSLTSRSDNADNLAVIAWSQGNPDTQWAYQYWPSTRRTTTDFISYSADFHGTVIAYLLDPAFPDIVPLPPGLIQQEYESNFIKTLRAGGGDSPYVPSTSIWSISDEIVQPQYDPYASAAYYSLDLPTAENQCPAPSNSVAAAYTNNQIQSVCAARPAGGVYTHEGLLYNPLAYALVLDALENDGPGQASRLDLDVVCNQLIAPGLSLADVVATEGLIPLAVINLLLYPDKVLDEPPVMAYAQGDEQTACSTTIPK